VSVVANVAINVDSRNAVGKLREVQAQSKQTERAFGGIAAAATKLAVAFGGIQAARFVFAKTAELESQSRSLAILAGSAEKAGQIIKELQDLGAVTPFTSTELIDSAKRLQAFGVEADKVVETTRRLADASGATGAELSGLVTAYGQVQAKGRLQGEELLQFQERGIALQEELRKMYGMTGEEFQKALSKGQVSAKAVEVALVNLTSAGGKYANGAIAQSDTLQGRLSTLQDGIDGLARGIGESLSPVIKAVLNEAIFAVNAINSLIATGARAKSFGLGDSQRKQILSQAQTEAQQLVEGRRIKDPFERNRQFQELTAQRERDLIESYGISTGQVKAAATAPQMAAQTPSLLGATSGGGGGGRAAGGGADKAANDAARAAEQAAQVEKQIQDRLRGLIREVELIDQIAGIKELQFQAEMDGNKELQIRLQGEERIIQIMQSTAQALDDITDERLKQNILAKAESEIASSRQETLFEMQRIDNERTKSFNEIIAGLDLELALKTATTEQAREQLRLEAEIAKLRGQGFTPEQIGTITAKKTELAAPKTDQQNITEKIATLKKEIADLTSISNIAITSAEGIGNAFAQSFQGLISGTMTAKEALGSFFKSVADMFLEMAAQIIAKQITMIILQTILKALGGGAFTGGTSSAVPTDAAGWGSSFNTQLPGLSGDIGRTPIGFARGGAFSNSIVSSPTMFKFANGGAMRTGLMGEAGPEAIMPLSRGADGSLGVQANGLREAMDRQQGGGSGSPVLNMSFQSTSINGVEYVSRDQLESAMAETRRNATRDGAKRGMTMTLDRIQNSSSTRRKVGI
jgi:lambda family phage tail tape measure protein